MNEMPVSALNLKVLHEVAHLMGVSVPEQVQRWVPAGSADEAAAPWVSSSVLDEAYRDLIAATGRPDFGLVMACSPVIARIGILPMLIMHSPHLAAALDNIIKYAALIQAHAELTLRTEGDEVILGMDVMHSSLTGQVCRAEFVALGITHILRLVGQGTSGLVRIAFPYPAPAHAEQYPAYFDCPLSFSSATPQIVFQRHMLHKTIFGADPMLYSAIVNRASLALSELKGQRGLVDQVSAILAQRLHERPRMDDVARSLGLGARTLRRRLTELGVDFPALLLRFQIERACALLAQGERSIQQIAGEVGFGSVSAFHRAFARWTGLTPKVWRERDGQPLPARAPVPPPAESAPGP
jgi:AraC-like DNA-binding protein